MPTYPVAIGRLAVVGLALLAGCQAPLPSQTPAPQQTQLVQHGLNDAQVGVAYDFDIVTEDCGLRGAWINGDPWVEEGALLDGTYPTTGFDRPIDSGTLRLTDRDHAEYRGEFGTRFTFVRTTQAVLDQLPICFD